MSQKFCNILVTWGILLSRLWRWQTTLDCGMPSLPDTLWELFPGFTSESSFRPTWPYLIIKVLATQAKFLHPSDYCIVINCIVIFHTINVFGCCCSVMVQFEPLSMLHVHLCDFQSHTDRSKAQYYTNYYNTTDYIRYLSQFKVLWSPDIDATN